MKSKFMRKLLALCVSAALVSGIGGSALAFSDVAEVQSPNCLLR